MKKSFEVVKKYLGEIFSSLFYVFNLSLQKCIFPDNLKVAKETLLFNAGDNVELGNYRLIFLLSYC